MLEMDCGSKSVISGIEEEARAGSSGGFVTMSAENDQAVLAQFGASNWRRRGIAAAAVESSNGWFSINSRAKAHAVFDRSCGG